jgi:hypothetical protein
VGEKALGAYEKISKMTDVKMHSKTSAEKRIAELKKDKETFMKLSRALAKKAQRRESLTNQPKEKLDGTKASISIKNYLGGYYYFTSDEVKLGEKVLHLIEGKHTKENKLPALEDIKDGLLKMVLFTNLEEVKINGIEYSHVTVLKLTTGPFFRIDELNKRQETILSLLKSESRQNKFKILINDKFF